MFDIKDRIFRIDHQHDLYPGNPVNLHVSLLIDHQHGLYPGNSVDIHGFLLIDNQHGLW